tara:strand:- start:176 stop:409 length:234 start_codon:yes stop_codon:yes gene_type:complete
MQKTITFPSEQKCSTKKQFSKYLNFYKDESFDVTDTPRLPYKKEKSVSISGDVQAFINLLQMDDVQKAKIVKEISNE